MNAVVVMSLILTIDIINCECHFMENVYDVICVPRVMTSILVVISSIQRV